MYYCNELFFRIIGHDVTPQFVNYGKSGQSKVQLISGKGDDCNNHTKENRECPTIHPFSIFSGDLAVCQKTFAGTGLQFLLLILIKACVRYLYKIFIF